MNQTQEGFFQAAARYLHFDPNLDTSIGLLWVLTSMIISILATVFCSHVAHKKLAEREAAATEQSIKSTLWMRLLVRSTPMIAPLLTGALATLGVIALRQMTYEPDLIIALKPIFVAWTFITAIYVVTHSIAKTVFVGLLVVPMSLPFILPYIREFEDMLAELSFHVGKTTITALLIIKILIIGTLMLWTASAVKDGLNASLNRMHHIRWSTRQLLQNLTSIGVYAMAILIGLSVLGIDLTAFAVLGGAIGVGIGLGLQKIASNFISGLILLSEQSIQVNDLIEVEGSGLTGLVRHTGARYTLIETIDNREIMIPNDDLVTNRVVNWTHSNSHGIISFDIGVSYDSDLDVVKQVLLDALQSHPLVLRDPAPNCLLKNFADSAVVFGVIAHLEDVRERRAGIKSELLFEIWRRFKEKNIDIPYPQMTLHYTPKNPPATQE